MDLLQKFAAVEVKADNRITDADKHFCEQHQKAYEAAIHSFRELAFFWADMNTTQHELLGDERALGYHDYLTSSGGPSISQRSIDKHIEGLHADFIEIIVGHFNSTYHVSVESGNLCEILLPQKPQERWGENEEKLETYHAQMQSLTVRYQDVVDQIILHLGGRSFSEQAFHELHTRCHNAAWNVYRQEAEFERKKDTIRFAGCFCSYRDYPWYSWDLDDDMREILRGAAHFETGSYNVFPLGLSELIGRRSLEDNVVEFSTCEKVKRIKLFKSRRVDLKFASAELAEEFIRKYLGTVC